MKFILQIGGPGIKDFADLNRPDTTAFDAALNKPITNGGLYKIRYKPNQGQIDEGYHPGHHASIKTDKVTTFEAARNAPAVQSAANDPHVTYRVTSNNGN